MDTQSGLMHTQDALMNAAEEIAVRRRRTRQPRPLSAGIRLLLWSLRIYVFLMLAVVVIQLERLM
jgi:hypothetical protein